ncbi:hypothetical protein M0802_014369 [Mischocyttarus mexicanus]|nr:hypothetical protein M0802_014369 [Mischocyttarus mexicanus]
MLKNREINKEVKLRKEKLNGKEIHQNNFERKVWELRDGQATSEVDSHTRKPVLEGKILEIIKCKEFMAAKPNEATSDVDNFGILTYSNSFGTLSFAFSFIILTFAKSFGILTFANSFGILAVAYSLGILAFANNFSILDFSNSLSILAFANNFSTLALANSFSKLPLPYSLDVLVFVK